MAETSHQVKTAHAEYVANLHRWTKINNVINGNVKGYLRDIAAAETDEIYAINRRKEYADGAILLNFTKRTLSGTVGAVMRKPPEIEMHEAMKYLETNADGSGVGLVQQSQDALRLNNSIGRGGLLTDAPSSEVATKAQQNAGKLNPRILLYTAENIVNWNRDGTYVVLRECYDYKNESNEFETLTGELWRVCELVDGLYQQRVFKFTNTGALVEQEVIEPKINGSRMDFVPFHFFGADNNDASVDNPPLETLADVNIGHFQNSADVEDSAFICGQLTFVIAPGQNYSPTQFKEANPNGVRLGNGIGLNLGYGGTASILQASAVTLPRELMTDKEEQAVKIGAQLIAPSAVITAESARLQRGADTSIMATAANNVSSAYELALGDVARMMNLDDSEIVFELNTEFFMLPMTAQDRAAWIMDINAGLMPERAYRAALRAAGVTNWTDEEIEEALAMQPKAAAPALNTVVDGEIPEAAADSEEA